MSTAPVYTSRTHVVDILGNVVGRDQPIMLMAKAIELASELDPAVFMEDDAVFFDPFCKAGEILLACAILRCRAKSKKRELIDADNPELIQAVKNEALRSFV